MKRKGKKNRFFKIKEGLLLSSKMKEDPLSESRIQRTKEKRRKSNIGEPTGD